MSRRLSTLARWANADQDGIGCGDLGGQLVAVLEADAGEHDAMPPRSRPDGRWSRAIQPITNAVTGSNASRTEKRPHRDPPQHVLVDAVADGVGEHADEEAGGEQRGVVHTGPLPGAPKGVSTTAPMASPMPRPATPRPSGRPEPTTM